MMGTEELDRFVALAARRLNTALAVPGHALHMVFERAPDEALPLAQAMAEGSRRQAGRLGLDLADLFDERARRIAPLIAAETLVLACWTRPAALAPDRLNRDRKRLRQLMRHWLPGAARRNARIWRPRASGPATRRCSTPSMRCSPRPASWANGSARTQRCASCAA